MKKSIFDKIKKGKTYKVLINGKWISSKRKSEVMNPRNRRTFAFVQRIYKKEVDLAVKSANKAKDIIASISPEKRAEMLEQSAKLIEKNKKEFISTLMKEAGKNSEHAEAEVNASIKRLLAVKQEINELEGKIITSKNKTALILRKPVGVILAITPFNYPLLTAVLKIAPALAAGNSVVLKPASDTPISSLLLGRVLEEAGFKKGINVITGSGSEIGDYLVKKKQINMITFTGNTNTGKHIAEIAGMKKIQLELGGKAPAIILEDADLDLAAKETVAGALKFSGQRCDAISRILVVNKIANKFVKKVFKQAKKWKTCPLINESACKKVESLIKDAKDKGAKIYGGKRKGLCIEPTILDNIKENMRIAWEETFGPVITIMRVKDEKQALKIAKASEYALDGSVFTKNIKRAIKLASKMDEGSVHINAHPTHGIGMFPYGGNKASGLGREGIKESIKNMTEIQTIVLKDIL